MAGPVAGRTKQSIEYKLRNVSKVFADLKVPYVIGYLPLDKRIGRTEPLFKGRPRSTPADSVRKRSRIVGKVASFARRERSDSRSDSLVPIAHAHLFCG